MPTARSTRSLRIVLATTLFGLGSASPVLAATSHSDVQAAAGSAMVRLATRTLDLARQAAGEVHPVVRFHLSRVDNQYVDLLSGEVKFPQPAGGLLSRYRMWVFVQTPVVDRHRYRVFADPHELSRLDPKQVMEVGLVQEREEITVTSLWLGARSVGGHTNDNATIHDPISFIGFYCHEGTLECRNSESAVVRRRLKTTARPSHQLVQDFEDVGQQGMELLNAAAEASPFELASAVHPMF